MDDSPNIIFLTIDALRADHCSWLGYDRETTPNLDAFAESGIDCRSCSSVSSHTREAMPSLLSGYPPSRFAANGFKPTTDPLLAERLSQEQPRICNTSQITESKDEISGENDESSSGEISGRLETPRYK